MEITLEEITEDTLNDALALEVTPEQSRFTPPVAVSIAQAHFSHSAWFRAVYADSPPVGFVMLHLDGLKPKYTVQRFLIDKRYQRRGYGTAAMKQVIDFVRSLPEATELYATLPSVEHGAAGFLRKFGFVEAGKGENGETVMRLSLTD